MTTYKDKIGGSDIKHYDGVNRTFDRQTSSGGTLTQAKFGNVVDVLQAYGDGVTITESALTDAVSQIGTNEACLELAPGAWPITADLTIPSTISIRLVRGATFAVSAAQTLTISGYVFPEEATWYSGAGTVTVTAKNVMLPGSSGYALVSANDTTLGPLNGKLVGSTTITLTEGSDGGNETLTASIPASAPLVTPTIASFANATHDHQNAAGGGATLTSPTIVTPTIASFVNANHDHADAEGGGTAIGINGQATGDEIRTISLLITNGTNATTVRIVSGNGGYNNVVAIDQNNLGKGGTGTYANLSADGSELTLNVAALGGSVQTSYEGMTVIMKNSSATDLCAENTGNGSNGIDINFTNATTGADVDLTTLVDTGNITISVWYVTNG